MTSKTFSTNKIIVLVAFFSAALISMLFIFHLQQKPTVVLPENQGLVFEVSRDIKPFELMGANNKKFTQKDLYKHWTLLFFGFTHCASVCPTTLDLMNRVYSDLHTKYPNLQVALISLDPERDTPEIVNQYAHSFNPEFIGVTGAISELRKLQSQLGVYSGRDEATSKTNYQLQHTSSIMLINPQGKWAGFFRFGLTPENLENAFITSVESAKNKENLS